MANVKVVIAYPTTRTDGFAFAASEVASVLLEEKASSATTWAAVGAPMAPGELTRTVQNIPAGAWDFRATLTDTQGRVSAPAIASIPVPSSAAPNAVTITLSLV